MGHSRAEKAQSRERILAAASTRIREAGLEGISVGELMKSVNLTHGGFYGHFDSRDALIAAALEQASAAHSGPPGKRTVKSIVNNYLSPAHRDHPNSGCAIPTLAGEVGRAEPEVRAIMAEQLDRSLDVMTEALGTSGKDAEQFAMASWSMMVGAIMVSRVFKDDPRADQILAAARKAVLELEGLHGEKAG